MLTTASCATLDLHAACPHRSDSCGSQPCHSLSCTAHSHWSPSHAASFSAVQDSTVDSNRSSSRLAFRPCSQSNSFYKCSQSSHSSSSHDSGNYRKCHLPSSSHCWSPPCFSLCAPLPRPHTNWLLGCVHVHICSSFPFSRCRFMFFGLYIKSSFSDRSHSASRSCSSRSVPRVSRG